MLNIIHSHSYGCKILSLAVKAMDVGIWDYDIDQDVLHCDSRWYDIVGAEPGTVKKIADFEPFIHPDDVSLATQVNDCEVDHLIKAGEKYHAEFRIIRPDGQTRLIRSVACVIYDNLTQRRRAIGCVTDVAALIDDEDASTTSDRLSDQELTSVDADHGDEPTIAAQSDGNPLSDRECECLKWVSVGKTAWETATIMRRSPRTVEFHLANAIRKLSASNKIHAAVIAVRNRWV